jgi:YbbR domain-containing protein
MLRKLTGYIPTLLLAFALSAAVWILAITAEDPAEVRAYPYPVAIEIIGQDPSFIITNDPVKQLTINLRAPKSVWTNLLTDRASVRAVVDLSDLSAGPHNVPVQVQIIQRPVEIVSYSPSSIDGSMEPLQNKTFAINLVMRGDPAVGYKAEDPVLSKSEVAVSGSETLVKRVQKVQAVLEISQAQEDVERTLSLQALDNNDIPITGLTINPDRIQVTQKITQRGGYRNVVVKVATNGNVANGYRLTNISAYPPNVTVFSTDPKLVDDLPGYVDTAPFNLAGLKDDKDIRVSLNLPPGVSIVGDQTVNVQIGVSAIESSVTLNNMRVELIGVGQGLTPKVSPETVDVILSGPIPLLDTLKATDVRVYLDLSDDPAGTYKRTPQVEINIPEIRVQSILPGSIEVTLTGKISSLVKPESKGPA